MKKLISIMLLLAMVLGLFAGCGNKDKGNSEGLQSAVEYLTSMYQTAGKDEAILIDTDLDVLKSVVVDGVSYSVEWSVVVTDGAEDSVTVSESTKENHVKLDIPLHSGSDILFTATATVSDAEGNAQAVNFNYKVAGVQLAGEGMTMEELVEAAYALEDGEVMEGLAVLTGVVSMINTPYDAGYQNLTCTIVVGDLTSMPIKCYRLKGEGAETLKMKDTITVSGTLKNYNGTIEFDAGCMIDELIPSEPNDDNLITDPAEIVKAAYALEVGTSLDFECELTGTITTVETPYDTGYQNVTVVMTVAGCEDMPIKCYRLKGEGADRIQEGDMITVKGILMNYNGTIEFGQGCILVAIPSGGGIDPTDDQLKIVDEAYALEENAELPYKATLIGTITSVDTPYDATFQNITVTMVITGRELKPIKCYRLKGGGADTLAVGDIITVNGTIKKYGTTVEFDQPTLISVTAGTPTPGPMPGTDAEIVDEAYKLQRDQALPYLAKLTGKVTYVKELYNTQYKNITVVIQVPGREMRPLICYRMKGTDADKVAVGDTITVSGTIKNYNGSIQFDTGCTMTDRVAGPNLAPTPETDPLKIVDIAYGLEKDTEMQYDVTLTGKVTSVKDAYDTQYKNISVVIQVTGRESKPILIYRMKGDGADKLSVGATITVMGRIKNYDGTVEMVNGTMTQYTPSPNPVPTPETDPVKILAAAQNLNDNEELPYDVTLSGKVLSIGEEYNSEHKNITVNIAVAGTDQVLELYRLSGDGVEKIKVGDTVSAKGRIKKYYGKLEIAFGTMTNRIAGVTPDQNDYVKLVDAAYALAEGATLTEPAILKGKISALDTPYDSKYSNISVSIVVSGREDKPILCYRMKGDKVSNNLCVGDTITVSGILKNYKGTVEFDAGCQMTEYTSCGVTKPSNPKQIVDAAFALGKNQSLPYFATLTGVVKSIDSEYDATYKNVTLTMTVQGTSGSKDLVAYRLKGDAAASVAVGNTITVTGVIKNYVGTDKETGVEKPAVVEFDSGCVLESLQKSGSAYIVSDPIVSEVELNSGAVQPRAAETNVSKILNDAYALAEGESLSYQSTLTGKITSIKDLYNPTFGNISVWIAVEGYEDKPVLCYRVAGEGAEGLLVDDIITVTGTITNYMGTVEFAQGCTLDKVVPGGGTAPVAPEDPKQIVAEAYALEKGKSLPYMATLTGEITEIGTYNESYGDLTLNIVVEGKEFKCYCLKGENLLELAVGDTITVTGTIKNYNGTIEFDKPNLVSVSKGEPANVYYLFGYINGVDYACKDDEANMGEYRFVNGKVVATFTDNSYVGVKTEGNGTWYMTQGWLGMDTKTATLYDSSTLSNADKLYVPANTEFVFLLTENADGSLTLTYTENTAGDENDAPTTPAEIVDAAYALEDGQSLEGTYTLTGKIISVDYLYSPDSEDISVTMEIAGCEGKPIKCYRMKGPGVDVIGINDTITVTGVLKNYKGTIEFDAGCTLDSYVISEEPTPEAPSDPKQIVDEAYALANGASLPYTATLTGKILSVDFAYSEESNDMTVTIEVEGTEGKKPIKCYRLTGEGLAELKEGDEITVTGIIKNYGGTIEFDRGVLTTGESGEQNPGDDQNPDDENNNVKPEDGKTPAQIVKEAFELGNGESLSYEATLTGKITSVDYAYNATNGDITVSFTVEGKTIKCFRMTGTGIDKIKVGDTITVKGKIKNYNGTVEFDRPVLVSVTADTGNTGNTGDKGPDTGDYSLTAPMIVMFMATAALVVLIGKKKFYI